jgi:class 3 adenylate cyclase
VLRPSRTLQGMLHQTKSRVSTAQVALCRPAGPSVTDSPSSPTSPAELQRSKRDMLPPSSLPTGTVTFLFTDVEGSTRLLQQLGETYASVLGR